MRILRILVAALLLATLPIAQAPAQKAMIFGTDATSTPDAVTLPSVEAWFTQNFFGTGNGTQVPSYWVNKVGGEFSALIQTACSETLNMSVYNQTELCFASLFNSVKTIAPAEFASTVGVSIGPGFSNGLVTTFTTPAAGFVVAHAWINTSAVFPAGGSVELALTTNVSGASGTDTTTVSQYHEITFPVTSGESVTVNLSVTASSGTWSAVPCTYRMSYEFLPNGL